METYSYSSRQNQIARACERRNGSKYRMHLGNIFRAEKLSVTQDIHYSIELVMPSV
jgi:hypothetical protein